MLEGEGGDAYQRWHKVTGVSLKNDSFEKEIKSEYMFYKTLQEVKDEAKREGFSAFDIYHDTGDVTFYRLGNPFGIDYEFDGDEMALREEFNMHTYYTFFWNEGVL